MAEPQHGRRPYSVFQRQWRWRRSCARFRIRATRCILRPPHWGFWRVTAKAGSGYWPARGCTFRVARRIHAYTSKPTVLLGPDSSREGVSTHLKLLFASRSQRVLARHFQVGTRTSESAMPAGASDSVAAGRDNTFTPCGHGPSHTSINVLLLAGLVYLIGRKSAARGLFRCTGRAPQQVFFRGRPRPERFPAVDARLPDAVGRAGPIRARSLAQSYSCAASRGCLPRIDWPLSRYRAPRPVDGPVEAGVYRSAGAGEGL